MQIAVGHGQRDQGEIAEVPSGLFFRNLSEEGTITVLKLDVGNVNAFEGCEQGHRRSGGTADFDNADGSFSVVNLVGEEISERALILRQCVSVFRSQTNFGVEALGKILGKLGDRKTRHSLG